MARESIVGEKSLAFGKRIAKCYRYLKDKKKETVMSKQLLRCGTSIGANVREGLYAQSRKDFISKLNIALKEAGETDYWLEIIHSADYFTNEEHIRLRKRVLADRRFTKTEVIATFSMGRDYIRESPESVAAHQLA